MFMQLLTHWRVMEMDFVNNYCRLRHGTIVHKIRKTWKLLDLKMVFTQGPWSKDLFSDTDGNEVDKVTEKLQGVGIASGSADGAVLTTSKRGVQPNEWVASEISCRDYVAAKQVIFNDTRILTSAED
ncbi:hypothetical protein MKW98_013916 [Papaver atlanticum]|uniref:Uncharacterized protein n=1 Tax=Papaver atlanticum TaxID=357466 RepID=A0AAD4SDG7_9MAGN|nr:hypothetical protein MKW98_013916 [Papaver atlanticum]